MTRCEACGQPLPQLDSVPRITDQELNVLSAWWLLHSTTAAARFYGVSEQTVKNQLNNARRRNGIHSTSALAHKFMGRLRTMDELMMSHNSRRKAA